MTTGIPERYRTIDERIQSRTPVVKSKKLASMVTVDAAMNDGVRLESNKEILTLRN